MKITRRSIVILGAALALSVAAEAGADPKPGPRPVTGGAPQQQPLASTVVTKATLESLATKLTAFRGQLTPRQRLLVDRLLTRGHNAVGDGSVRPGEGVVSSVLFERGHSIDPAIVAKALHVALGVTSLGPKPDEPSRSLGPKPDDPSTSLGPKPDDPSTSLGPKPDDPSTSLGPKPDDPSALRIVNAEIPGFAGKLAQLGATLTPGERGLVDRLLQRAGAARSSLPRPRVAPGGTPATPAQTLAGALGLEAVIDRPNVRWEVAPGPNGIATWTGVGLPPAPRPGPAPGKGPIPTN